MASTNERFTLPQQVWFDAANPDPLHDALRADFARTRGRALQRPSLRRHMESCEVCQQIAAVSAAAPSPTSTRRRLKLQVDKAQMHQLLRLPASFEIVHMFAENDPNCVFILVAGEGLPEIDDLSDTLFVQVGDVGGDTPAGAS